MIPIKNDWKKRIRSFIAFIFILMILYLVFHKDYQSILISIHSLSIQNLLFLLFLGSGYLFLDVASYYAMMKPHFHNFTFKMAFEVTMLGIFANTSTSAAGTIPLQSYYLYKQHIPAGYAISTMVFECVFHKIAVVLCSLVMILFHIKWLYAELPQQMGLIALGFLFNLIFILALTLLCTNKRIQKFFLYIIHKIPDRGQFQDFKKSAEIHLNELISKSSQLLHISNSYRVILINILKLLWVYSIPFYCMKCCNIDLLSLTQSETLTSILFLISGIIINIAGVGPTEFTFILLFSPFIGRAQASSCLILYRIAQYFWPFLIAMITSLKLKKEYEKVLLSKK